MNLSDLQKEGHAVAIAKGWYDQEQTFGDFIALVHSELSEALEAYRAKGFKTWESYTLPWEPGDATKPEGVAYELADVVIRVAETTEYYGVNLEGKITTVHSLDPHESCPRNLQGFGEWIALCHTYASNALWESWLKNGEIYWASQLAALVNCVRLMAEHYDMDLGSAIEATMEYNRGRPFRHGEKAL